MTIPLPYPVRAPRGQVDYVCPFQGHRKTPYLRHNGWPIGVGTKERTQAQPDALERREQRNYICPSGHRWHVLDDGTWIYQGNADAGHALEDE